MSGGQQQNSNQVQSTNQNFNDVSGMVQNLSSDSIANLMSTGSTSSNSLGSSNTATSNNQQTQGGSTQNTSGLSTGTNAGTSAFANNPWAPALPQLNNILNQIGGIPMNLTPAQQAALAATQASAGSLPNFGNPATNAVSNMFGSMNGVPQAGMWGNAYGQYAGALSPFTNLSNLNPLNTPGFSDAFNTMNQDITNQIKSMYAGSGRDPTGAGSFAQSLGRGLSQGEGNLIQGQWNQNANNYLNAAANTFGAAGNTATGTTNLLQTPIQNEQAAINNAANVGALWMNPSTTQLGVANAAYGLPFGNINIPQQMVSQIAGLGQQGTGATTGQQTGATQGASTGTNFSGTTGTGTSSTLTAQQQQQLQQQQQQQEQQKVASGTTQGTQSGQQQGTSVGSSNTSTSQNPFSTAAGVGLGLFSMFG